MRSFGCNLYVENHGGDMGYEKGIFWRGKVFVKIIYKRELQIFLCKVEIEYYLNMNTPFTPYELTLIEKCITISAWNKRLCEQALKGEHINCVACKTMLHSLIWNLESHVKGNAKWWRRLIRYLR